MNTSYPALPFHRLPTGIAYPYLRPHYPDRVPLFPCRHTLVLERGVNKRSDQVRSIVSLRVLCTLVELNVASDAPVAAIQSALGRRLEQSAAARAAVDH